LREYIELLTKTHPFIATDFSYKPHWTLDKLPRNEDGSLLYWDYDQMPPKDSEGNVIDWSTKDVAVLTIKSLLTKLGILKFDLPNDNFDGNLLWCQNWCPLPEKVTYYESDNTLSQSFDMYFMYPDLFNGGFPEFGDFGNKNQLESTLSEYYTNIGNLP
jgi:hypothetical protein